MFPIHEYGYLFIYLSLSSSFLNVLWFLVYRYFTCLIKFIPKNFIVFDTIWMGLSLFLFQIVCCLFIEMQLTSVCWLYILQLYWIHWLVLTVCVCACVCSFMILVKSLVFYIYKIMSSANIEIILHLFHIWTSFISFYDCSGYIQY